MGAADKKLKPVFLLGATACGKTDVAMELVKSLPAEIISVDSALVYRRMDIGTAKPTIAELEAAPHRLIDVLEPWESYSVSNFIEDAHQQIAEVQANGNIPLLVGGTMLYYKALESGLSQMPSADDDLRQQLEDKAREIGWEAMHCKLQSVDPESAARIHPNDPQRIQRALEIYYASGRTMTDWHKNASSTPGLKATKFALFPQNRTSLHQRIADRFDAMLDGGFIEEVEELRKLPQMNCELPSMRSVGYRQVWQYLEGDIDKNAMRDKGIAATRQLAKRQITWMRKMESLTLFDSFRAPLSQIAGCIAEQLSGNQPAGPNH